VAKIKVIHRKLGKHMAYGLAHQETNTVEIDSTLPPKKKLEIMIHEPLHIICPEMSEEQVTKIGKQLGKFLWENNYREVKQK